MPTSQADTKLANNEEKELVEKLLTRLDDVQGNMDHEKKGTFDDLRAGLYFFMKQREEPFSDWFVKNFEQIDGDVLNSKEQNKIGRGKIYHFACVSDKDMNCKINDLLPWPLSEYFIEKAYNPKDLQFQVYFASLSERSNFLRYELFFGLYYCQCDVKISYVRYYDEDETDLYQLLKLIGLKKVTKKKIKAEGNTARTKDKFNSDKVKKLNIMPEERGAMFLCPYKYLMNYVINSGVTYSGKFFAQRFFIAVITDRESKRFELAHIRYTLYLRTDSTAVIDHCRLRQLFNALDNHIERKAGSLFNCSARNVDIESRYIHCTCLHHLRSVHVFRHGVHGTVYLLVHVDEEQVHVCARFKIKGDSTGIHPGQCFNLLQSRHL